MRCAWRDLKGNGLAAVLSLGLVLGQSAGAEAQEKPNYSLAFSQNDDNLSWSHSFGFGSNLGEGGSIRVSNQIRNALNKGFGGSNRWSDSNSGNLSIAVPLQEALDFNINVSLQRSSDNFGGRRRPLETKNFGSGMTLRPFASFGTVSLRQTLGGQLDQRLGRRDAGLSFSSSLDVKPKALEKRDVSFSWSRSGNTSARSAVATSVTGRGNLDAGKFANFAASFSGRVNALKRVSTVDSTLLDNLKTSHSFRLSAKPVESGKAWQLSLNFSQNRTEDDANDDPRDRVRFQKDQRNRNFKLSADNESAMLGTSIKYGLDYSVDDKNVDDPLLDRRTIDVGLNSSTRLWDKGDGASGASGWWGGPWTISGNIRKLQIDTPEGVINDKDEWRGSLNVTHVREFKDGLKLTIPIFTSQSHSVSLNARESANNRWSRIYAIKPKIAFEVSPDLDLKQRVELSVNRSDFDFDDADKPRSDIIRKFRMDNDIDWKVGDKLSTHLGYDIQIQDSGKLFPGGFQRVDEKRFWQTLSLSFNYPWSQTLNISPAFEYRRNRNWQPATGRLRRRDIDKNLTANVTYNPASSNRITFRATRSIRNGLRVHGRVRDRISATYSRTF